VETCGILMAASCTRFSPKCRMPASHASIMAWGGNLLVMATMVTSWGDLPALRQAAAMRFLTSSTLWATVSVTTAFLV